MSTTTFGVVDLSKTAPFEEAASPLAGAAAAVIDLDRLRGQLNEIRDALSPVLDQQSAQNGFRLSSMELQLTVGLEGKVWFVAKGTGEASLKLTWSRGTGS
jgi:hypothetical protein